MVSGINPAEEGPKPTMIPFRLVRQKVSELQTGGSVSPPYLLKQLIEKSAWWYGHPQSPTRAPNHAERLAQGRHGWEIEFGANRFLVEKGLILCKQAILDALDEAEASRTYVDGRMLREKLIRCVSESVADYSHSEYFYGYRVESGFMHFGTQAINVSDFVSEIYKLATLRSVCGP